MSPEPRDLPGRPHQTEPQQPPVNPEMAPAQAAEVREQFEPSLQCSAREWATREGNPPMHIYIVSDDPRWAEVVAAYKELHPEGYGMGVTTEEMSIHGLPVDEARIKAAQVIERISKPGYLEELREVITVFKKAKEAYELASDPPEALQQLADLYYEDPEVLAPFLAADFTQKLAAMQADPESVEQQFREAEQLLVEAMPPTTDY